MSTPDEGWSIHSDDYDPDERYVGPPMPDGSRWRVCSDMGDTFVLVPEGADGRAIERAVRGTALQRWQDGCAADEVFGPGCAW